MRLDKRTGLIAPVHYVPSPNFDLRPTGTDIDLLVIHNISLPPGEFGGSYIDDFFQNKLNIQAHPYFNEIRDLKVSSHCLIRRTGELTQYVPFQLMAWHAGASQFMGRDNCNNFSIGIELEGADEVPYAREQYDCLVALIRVLQKAYPKITMNRIVGHSTIAPGRKTDPGPAFDWQLLRDRLANKN